MSSIVRRWLPWLTVMLICLLQVDRLSAQLQIESCQIMTRDTGQGVLGVTFFNEYSSGDSNGCLHFEVVCPAGPSPSDRTLQIMLYVNSSDYDDKSGVAHRTEVTLPEGATTVRGLLPYFISNEASVGGNSQHFMAWDLGVYENGRSIEAGRALQTTPGGGFIPETLQFGERSSYYLSGRYAYANGVLHLLEDGASPDRSHALRMQMAQHSGPPGNLQATSILTPNGFDLTRDATHLANFRSISSAPEYWQYYLQFRMVMLNEKCLAALREYRPNAAQAIKEYVAAGGNFILLSDNANGRETLNEWFFGDSSPPSVSAWSFVRADKVQSWNEQLESFQNTSFDIVFQNRRNVVSSMGGMESEASYGNQSVRSILSQDPILASLLASKRGQTLKPMTLGGSLRDGMLLAAIYPYCKFSAHRQNINWLMEISEEAEEPQTQGGMGPNIVYDNWGQPVSPTPGLNIMVSSDGQSSLPSIPVLTDWLWSMSWTPMERLATQLESRDPSNIAIRSYVRGRVANVADDLAQISDHQLTALCDQLPLPVSRSLSSVADETWGLRNLIGSVGKPPVWQFCGIVILFGFVLGPGLLILTGWVGRRSLLIFLVPAVSVCATCLIIFYQVVHEGFDTSVRVASLITVDESTGDGFVWSRQTYFSGWPPREGLKFDRNVYFRPVVTSLNNYPRYSRGSSPPRDGVQSTIITDKDVSTWTAALPSRQQKQFLIGHPTKSSVPLKVTQVSAKQIEVQNLTDEELPFVILRGQKNIYYFTERMPAGAEITLEAQVFGDIAGALSRLRSEYVPALPADLQGAGLNISQSANSIEVLDSAWFGLFAEQAINSTIPVNGFVTLQQNRSEIFRPLAGQATESQHLITGTLKW